MTRGHEGKRTEDDGLSAASLGSGFPGEGARTWRPRPALLALTACIAVAALTWAVLAVVPIDRVVAGVLTILLLVVTVIGRRRRLVAGPRGLLVCGTGGRRIVPWSQVRSMDNVTSGRFGLSTTTLEIDLVDDDLLLFGRTELGTDPAEVLAVLSGWWPG